MPPLPPALAPWPHHQSPAEMVPNPAAELFVLFTLATLFFILGAFALWMWLLSRRAANPPPHVKLIMELQEDEESAMSMPAGPDQEKPEPQPWERPADWWRKPR